MNQSRRLNRNLSMTEKGRERMAVDRVDGKKGKFVPQRIVGSTITSASLFCIILLLHSRVHSLLNNPSPPGRFIQHAGHKIIRKPAFIKGGVSSKKNHARRYNSADDLVDMDESYDPAPELPDIGGDEDDDLCASDLEQLTVAQLKQQLRLRGLKVSGKKTDLIQRLLGGPERLEQRQTESTATKARKFAADKGKEFVDVTAYLDEEDVGKNFKSSYSSSGSKDEEEEDVASGDNSDSSSSSEVWGSQARMVEDYEGRSVVVDCLTRTTIEFLGSNQSYVQAYVVASRDALKPFLAGGGFTVAKKNETTVVQSAEDKLLKIQQQREAANRRPVSAEDQAGIDEGDETGLFDKILDRDFSDWGKYTQTGAQLSAAEVQGVLFLSDVYGPFNEDTKILADKIAFECQPCVVMVPDLFRGEALKSGSLGDMAPADYEQWRAKHPNLRVSVDIRAAASCLRQRYGVNSIALWGTCYGGGRALEAASGWAPSDSIHDIDGSLGPPPVDPMVVLAWYPTRYEVTNLFGQQHRGTSLDLDGKKRSMAVMGVFAGRDTIPGATQEDARKLRMLLEEDDRVKDYMVKVFPSQIHGFAHNGLAQQELQQKSGDFERLVDNEFGGAGRVTMGDGDADVACLLSTAFMETYSRVFLPTVGVPVSADENNGQWSAELEMSDFSESNTRDIRQEIEDALDSYVDEPLGGFRIDPDNKESAQENEMAKLLRSMEEPEQAKGPYAITDDDDLETIYAKLKAADDDFQIF